VITRTIEDWNAGIMPAWRTAMAKAQAGNNRKKNHYPHPYYYRITSLPARVPTIALAGRSHYRINPVLIKFALEPT